MGKGNGKNNKVPAQGALPPAPPGPASEPAVLRGPSTAHDVMLGDLPPLTGVQAEPASNQDPTPDRPPDAPRSQEASRRETEKPERSRRADGRPHDEAGPATVKLYHPRLVGWRSGIITEVFRDGRISAAPFYRPSDTITPHPCEFEHIPLCDEGEGIAGAPYAHLWPPDLSGG